jgi:hypothetical protein
MYTYTPHIEGNENFWEIWNSWFERPDYPSGSLLRDINDGGVWLIKYGARHLIKNEVVLNSFYDVARLIDVDKQTIEEYDVGSTILFPNYSLVEVENGDIYLLVDDKKRRFVSADEVKKFGYMQGEIIKARIADLDTYANGTAISYTTEYASNALVMDTATKKIYCLDGNKKYVIVSNEILRARYNSARVATISSEKLLAYPEGDAITFPDGALVKMTNDPMVYVISDGRRRPIKDEATFIGLGYKWSNIITTSSQSLEVHQPGEIVEIN